MMEGLKEAAAKGFAADRFEKLVGKDRGRIFRIMEVCGTHTMAIAKFGIKTILPPGIRLVSGPGCPVCVTCQGYIDAASAIARRKDVIMTTFGDMVKVPGSGGSLADVRAEGSDVRVVYSPLDCIRIASENPHMQVVFLSIGFETTTPATALMIMNSRRLGLRNLSILSGNKTLPAVLEMVASDEDRAIDGFLYPGHVSVITGIASYERIAERFGIPGVVTGFEPMDILQAVFLLLTNIINGNKIVMNAYSRVVRNEGNIKARTITDDVFEACDAYWRGIGKVPGSGLKLRDSFRDMDAWKIYDMIETEPSEPTGCICGSVIMGRASPEECGLFGKDCTPDDPAGPCMVSSEGACAAAFRYGR